MVLAKKMYLNSLGKQNLLTRWSILQAVVAEVLLQGPLMPQSGAIFMHAPNDS